MKKKLLFGLITFTTFFVTIVSVAALVNTTPAKSMNLDFAEGDVAFAITDDNAFADFATYVQFSAKTGSDKITPKTGPGELTKIIITPKPNTAKAAALDIQNTTAVELAGTNWLTAYCLDAQKKLPQFSIYNLQPAIVDRLLNEQYSNVDGNGTSARKADRIIGGTTLLALLNNKTINGKLSEYYSSSTDVLELTYAFVDENGTLLGEQTISTDILARLANPQGDVGWDFENWATDTQAAAAHAILLQYAGGQLSTLLSPSTSSATVLVKQLSVKKLGESTPKVITAADLKTLTGGGNAGTGLDNYFKFTYSGTDILFDKYYAHKSKDYRQALWIIEHSYPSMTASEFLKEAGVNETTLKTQLLGLSSEYTEENYTSVLDNYLYWTTQYAIWKSTDMYESNGKKLGDDLYLGSLGTDSELNKVYKHLTKGRDEYTTYGDVNYNTDKIIIDKTNIDKVKTEGDYYLYGPLTASYNVITPENITYTIESGKTDSVSIVGEDGKELTSIANGVNFYIRCKKSAKVTNVKIDFAARGKSFADNGAGTILYANFVGNQNVILGAKYVDVNGTASEDLQFNPKTGVPNIAIVFVITLIAFALGYLALSYNNKSMELN